jgi:two-component system sensor histidine kinase UhpB
MTVRQFLDSFPLAVTGVDSERRVALWNAAAERLLGWSAADVVGKPDPSVPLEVAAEHKTMWEAAFRGDTAMQRESARITRDGTLLDVEITTASDDGLALMFLRDVTERRAEEDRLAERENQLRLMLEQLPAIIATYDDNLVFTAAQGAGLRALGADASAFVGVALPDLIGEDAAPLASIRAALRGESSTNEYEYLGRWYANRAEPLRRRDGTIAGAINLGFDITERRQAETALRESREQLRSLSVAMNRVQEEQRRRISRELHDELGQLLTSLRLDLGLMRRELRKVPTAALEARIGTMVDLVDLTIKTVRRVATELRPRLLDDFGLRAALENETTSFTERTGIDVKLTIRGDQSIDADSATALYRIVQEGLTNVARHSGATRVNVRIEACAGRVEAELRDNGRGITETEVNDASALGLLGVRERAFALGGEAVIEAVPDGTRVFVSLPQ